MKKLLQKPLARVIRIFWEGFSRHRISTYAASGAFYMFLSLFPFLMLMFAVLPYTSLTQDMLMNLFRDFFPESTMKLIDLIVSDVYDSSLVLLSFSALTTIWSASKAFSELIKGMEHLNDVTEPSSYLVRKFRASIYTLVLLLSILLSLIGMVWGGKLMRFIVSLAPETEPVFSVIMRLRWIFVLGFLTTIFTLIYKWIPHLKTRYTRELPGAVLAAAAWVVFSMAFSVYVSYGNYSTYGSLATIVIGMLWMYYCMYIILLGNYMNRFFDRLREMRKTGKSASAEQ